MMKCQVQTHLNGQFGRERKGLGGEEGGAGCKAVCEQFDVFKSTLHEVVFFPPPHHFPSGYFTIITRKANDSTTNIISDLRKKSNKDERMGKKTHNTLY